jgi:hypothetical protein
VREPGDEREALIHGGAVAIVHQGLVAEAKHSAGPQGGA